MATGGIAMGISTGGADLRHNHPGHRTDGVVIDRPERKQSVAAARAEELAPPADRVAKPARRGNGSARRRWKKRTPAPAATVDRGGEMQTYGRHEKEARTTVHDGRDRHGKKTPATPPRRRWGDEEESTYEEEEEEAEFVMVGGVRCRRTAATGAAEEEEAEFILVGGVLCPTVAPRARKAAVAGGITVGGTNMRDLHCGNGPGHVVDVVHGRKQEKVAAVVVQVEETPSTASVAERHETAPAAIVDDGSKVQTDRAAENKEATVPDVEEVTAGREEKETATESPSEEEEEASKQEEEAAEEEMSKQEGEKKFIDVVTTGGSRSQTVARRTSTAAVAGGITVGGANMWAALCRDDPGHGARAAKPVKKRGKKTKKNKKRVVEDSKQADAVQDIDDIVAEEVAAAVVVEVVEAPPTASVAKKNETAPAAIVDDGSKVQADVAAEDKEETVPDAEEVTDGREEKETAPAAIVDDGGKVQTTTVPDGDEVTDGRQEKETEAVSPGDEEEEATGEQEEEAAEEEMSKEEEGKKFMGVVTTGGSHCQTVTKRTSTAAVAGGITVGSANMWAALCDHDPGHGAGGAKPAKKRGKKTKKNKKRVAEDSKQADAVDDGVVQIGSGHEEQETPAELPDNVEGEEPGHGAGGAKPAKKRGKKTKKNKKRVAQDSKHADALDDGVVQIGRNAEEEEEEKTAGAGTVATDGGRCREVAGTICRMAVATAVLLALCCVN